MQKLQCLNSCEFIENFQLKNFLKKEGRDLNIDYTKLTLNNNKYFVCKECKFEIK